MTHGLYRFGILFIAASIALACGVAPSANAARNANGSFFPLVPESRWIYQCTAAGEEPFTKTVALGKESVTRNGVTYLSVATQIDASKVLVAQYYYVDSKGIVYVTPDKDPAQAQPVASLELKPNEKIGDMNVAQAPETIEVPALGSHEAVRLESLSHNNDPSTTAEHSTEWRRRYYARGVGLILEEDGLGNGCELVKYRIGPFAPPRVVP